MSHSDSHANTGGQVAIAFGGNNTSGSIDVSTACNTKGGSGRMDFESKTFVVVEESYIRRLTPRECERLQGFPDDYTLILWTFVSSVQGERMRPEG